MQLCAAVPCRLASLLINSAPTIPKPKHCVELRPFRPRQPCITMGPRLCLEGVAIRFWISAAGFSSEMRFQVRCGSRASNSELGAVFKFRTSSECSCRNFSQSTFCGASLFCLDSFKQPLRDRPVSLSPRKQPYPQLTCLTHFHSSGSLIFTKLPTGSFQGI